MKKKILLVIALSAGLLSCHEAGKELATVVAAGLRRTLLRPGDWLILARRG